MGVCEYEGVAGTHLRCVFAQIVNTANKQFKNREYRNQQYLFQSFLAVFLRGRDEFTGLDRRRRASRLRRGRLRLQFGGNYEIRKPKCFTLIMYITFGSENRSGEVYTCRLSGVVLRSHDTGIEIFTSLSLSQALLYQAPADQVGGL